MERTDSIFLDGNGGLTTFYRELYREKVAEFIMHTLKTKPATQNLSPSIKDRVAKEVSERYVYGNCSIPDPDFELNVKKLMVEEINKAVTEQESKGFYSSVDELPDYTNAPRRW